MPLKKICVNTLLSLQNLLGGVRNIYYSCNAYSNYINLYMCLNKYRFLIIKADEQVPTTPICVAGTCEITLILGYGIRSVFFEFGIGFEEFDVGEAQVLEGVIGHFSPNPC